MSKRVLRTTEDLVALYDYIFRQRENIVHPKVGRLAPYASDTKRDNDHLWMIGKIIAKEQQVPVWKPSAKPTVSLTGKYSVLDASCGRGHLLRTLLAQGFRAQGTEISQHLILNELKDLPVTRATYDDIDCMGTKSFDIVISNDVLEHLLDEDMVNRAVRNLHKISKKWLCISVGGDTAAKKYSQALALEMRGLHTFRREREWWRQYLSKFMTLETLDRRTTTAFFYGEKK